MSVAPFPLKIGASPGRRDAPAIVAGLTLGVAAFLLAPTLAILASARPLWLEDDAYYYAVIARRLAQTGVSSFDGRTLTNGYHPLWLLIVAAQSRLAGASPFATLSIEAVLMAGGFAVLATTARARNAAWLTIFACLYAHYLGAMSMSGMEVSLLVFCAAVFVHALAPAPAAPDAGSQPWVWRGGGWLGLAGALCIGARIDSAVFVLPAIVLAPRLRAERLVALSVIAAGGAVYAVVNLLMFGTATPISSTVKSLGGLQLNHRYLAQLAQEAVHPLGHARHLTTLAVLAAAAAIAGSAPARTRARALGWACAIGGVLFFVKVALFSSWRVWPWYDFPLVFAFAALWLRLTPAIEAGAERAGRSGGRRRLALSTSAIFAVLALCVLQARNTIRAVRPSAGGFALVNARAAARFAPILRGRAVAMGDRAGSFAAAYPGSVVQLEGLVNDVGWLGRLRRGGEVNSDLCARDVGFLLAWRPDLGRYDEVHVPVLRPALTQFPGPIVSVRRRDELGQESDPALYDDADDEKPNRLYLWRLECSGRGAAWLRRHRADGAAFGR